MTAASQIKLETFTRLEYEVHRRYYIPARICWGQWTKMDAWSAERMAREQCLACRRKTLPKQEQFRVVRVESTLTVLP